MPLINLIEEQRLAIRERERRTRVMVFGSLAIAVVGFILGGYFFLEGASARGKASVLEAKLETVQPIVEETKATERNIKRLEPRLVTLQGAQNDTLRWSRILDYFTTNTPEGIYLSNIQCRVDNRDEAVTMTVRGIATNQEEVGSLLLRMQLNEDLEEVTLNYTQSRTTDRVNAIEFEIAGVIKGTRKRRAQEGSA